MIGRWHWRWQQINQSRSPLMLHTTPKNPSASLTSLSPSIFSDVPTPQSSSSQLEAGWQPLNIATSDQTITFQAASDVSGAQFCKHKANTHHLIAIVEPLARTEWMDTQSRDFVHRIAVDSEWYSFSAPRRSSSFQNCHAVQFIPVWGRHAAPVHSRIAPLDPRDFDCQAMCRGISPSPRRKGART